MDEKTALRESRLPIVVCPKGHTYCVPLRFFRRNVRRVRTFICPQCLEPFRIGRDGKIISEVRSNE